jgi:hypothetical protein
MEESGRNDIRRLLKTFGVQADELILTYLAQNPDRGPLHLRLTMTDLTDYGESPPDNPLNLEVEGIIRR